MDSSQSRSVNETERRSTDRPAVGIFADPTAADAVAGAIIRAQQHGLDVLVIHETDSDSTAVKYARQLGATIVNARAEKTNGQRSETRLIEIGKRHGYPGVVYQENPTDRVDFTASFEALRDTDQYLIEAIHKPAIGKGPNELVAIPAYNEEQAIANVVSQALPHADEVVVIDDGSSDDTAERARDAGATVIKHEYNQGYGAALNSAFREAERCGADHLIVLDGDGQHDPTDIQRLVQRQKDEDAELVIGSRFADGSQTSLPTYRRIGIQIVNLLTNLSLGIIRPQARVADTQSGFRVYNRRAIESLAADDAIDDQMGASIDILRHAHHHDYTITEVGTTIDYEVENSSTHNPVAHGLHLVRNVLRTVEEEHPIAVLGVPGFASTLLGIAFGYLTIMNYIESAVFPLGLAVLTALFALSGIFACFTAIILHSLNQHLD